MSHLQALKLSGLAVAVLALSLVGSESLSYDGIGNLPQTPCPCAADGVCRPKRDSWGHYKTRWRSWPGELTGQQPTRADGTTAGEGEKQDLSPYELPLPEQEDLRGPAKDKAEKEEAAEVPADGPAQLLPGPEALPAFDPQGNHQQLEIPGMDDAPPALPASLRQAALLPQAPALNMPQLTSRQQSPAVQSPRNSAARSTHAIRQASWQQSNSIQLINPASAVLAEPGASNLQQAIYYEASDLEEASVE